jgi:hypothetical protein
VKNAAGGAARHARKYARRAGCLYRARYHGRSLNCLARRRRCRVAGRCG